MVGIVIVSHSQEAAEGIRKIAAEMGKPKQPITAAGGDNGHLGIDLDEVEAAIDAADQNEGVIIFADLGSAVFCAEMIKKEKKSLKSDIYVADAPILEGAAIAAVEASLGSPVEKVLAVASKVKKLSKMQV